MRPVEFPEVTNRIAEDQPEYETLPAHVADDGRIVFCWELTPEEVGEIVCTGKIWHTVLSFGQPLQPQLLQVDNPFAPLASGCDLGEHCPAPQTCDGPQPMVMQQHDGGTDGE